MKFTEAQLEQAFIELLQQKKMLYWPGAKVREVEGIVLEPRGKYNTAGSEVIIQDDLKSFLKKQYAAEGITQAEVSSVIRDLQKLPASDLYESNWLFWFVLCHRFRSGLCH